MYNLCRCERYCGDVQGRVELSPAYEVCYAVSDKGVTYQEITKKKRHYDDKVVRVVLGHAGSSSTVKLSRCFVASLRSGRVADLSAP